LFFVLYIVKFLTIKFNRNHAYFTKKLEQNSLGSAKINEL